MLQLEIPAREFYDEVNGLFINFKQESLQLEHSLVSLSKWESTWCKPFFGNDKKTDEETADYIRCMTITQHVNPLIYNSLPDEVIEQVEKYINSPMTATWFSNNSVQKSSEIITSEVIYYYMIALGIPIECQKWHLNRLLTLIRICNIKNQAPKKQNKRDMLNSRNQLNKMRREQMHTSG